MELSKQKEIELHKEIAKDYLVRYGPDFAQFYQHYWNSQLLKNLPLESNLSVLDCGCGTGILLKDLIQRYKRVVGLDISPEMMALIEPAIREKSELVIGDAENLPFPENYFDIVISRGTLHHLPQPAKALQDIYRILRPTGFFVLTEPSDDSWLLRWPRWWSHRLSRKFSSTHRAFLSQELEDLLKEAGFIIEQKQYFGYLAFPFCGLPDHLPCLKYLPQPVALTKLLIKLDELFSCLPLIKKQAWHIIIIAKKS